MSVPLPLSHLSFSLLPLLPPLPLLLPLSHLSFPLSRSPSPSPFLSLSTSPFPSPSPSSSPPPFPYPLPPGITETIAQLGSGWLADKNPFHKYHYHKAYLILCGVVNLFAPLANTYIKLMVYAVFFAIFCGGYMALLLPVLVRITHTHTTQGTSLTIQYINISVLVLLIHGLRELHGTATARPGKKPVRQGWGRLEEFKSIN